MTAMVAAATAIATVPAAITAEVTSAATAATIFARPGFVNLQHPTSNFLAVELLNCRRRFFLGRHFDESETFRSASVAIFNYARRFNRARLSKQCLEILTGGLESKVSNIEFI
jgi:hypothetical protein